LSEPPTSPIFGFSKPLPLHWSWNAPGAWRSHTADTIADVIREVFELYNLGPQDLSNRAGESWAASHKLSMPQGSPRTACTLVFEIEVSAYRSAGMRGKVCRMLLAVQSYSRLKETSLRLLTAFKATKERGKNMATLERSEITAEQIGPKPLGEGEIAVLAYRLWQERGRPIGSPEEDWFNAEKQLNSERKTTAAA
jgi:hypothetical protein